MPDVQPVSEFSWLCHVTKPQAANSMPNSTRAMPSTVNGHSSSVKSTAEKSRSLTARFDQRRSVIAEHLQEALAPTQALTPALREGDRLLVVQDGGAAVADAVAVQHAVHGEFRILGE